MTMFLLFRLSSTFHVYLFYYECEVIKVPVKILQNLLCFAEIWNWDQQNKSLR